MELWTSCQSQWRASGFGLVGLDYPAMYLVAQTLGIEVTPVVLAKIQVLEREVLKRQHKKDQT